MKFVPYSSTWSLAVYEIAFTCSRSICWKNATLKIFMSHKIYIFRSICWRVWKIYVLKHFHPGIMKIYIKVCDRLFELRISSKTSQLSFVSHMIKITDFYTERKTISYPCIHHRNPEMIHASITVIKWSPVFTDVSIIDKYCSSKYFSINWDEIRSIRTHSILKKFSCHPRYYPFIWIRNFCLLIECKKFFYITRSFNNNLPIFFLSQNMFSMISSWARPFFPIFCCIKNTKTWTRAMDIKSIVPSRKFIPSYWFFYDSQWSPKNNPVRYTKLFEIFRSQ